MVRISLHTYSKLITDQVITTEEHHAAIGFLSSSIPTQSSNLRPSQRHKTSSLLKEVISNQLECIIQAGLSVGDINSSDRPSVSLNLSKKDAARREEYQPSRHP